MMSVSPRTTEKAFLRSACGMVPVNTDLSRAVSPLGQSPRTRQTGDVYANYRVAEFKCLARHLHSLIDAASDQVVWRTSLQPC